MKGIILAGGTGSRLAPLTRFTNKHLLPVGRYPMICHPFIQLVRANITEILVITDTKCIDGIASWLGSGHGFGVKVSYQLQDTAAGIAQALSLARTFVQNDLCTVVLGDNMFTFSLSPYVENFINNQPGAQIILKEVQDPRRYGVAQLRDGKIISIEEKPVEPKSNYAVTGIYMYDCNVFDIIDTLVPSDRGEYEITDVNRIYLDISKLQYAIAEGGWIDAGTFESLHLANSLMMGQIYHEFDSIQ